MPWQCKMRQSGWLNTTAWLAQVLCAGLAREVTCAPHERRLQTASSYTSTFSIRDLNCRLINIGIVNILQNEMGEVCPGNHHAVIKVTVH